MPETTLFFAVWEGESVGVAVIGQAFSDSSFRIAVDARAHISTVAVKPHYWGRGIAHRLMIEMLNEARQSQYCDAQLWVHCSNVRAISLYERFGFRSVGMRRRYYQDTGEDAIIMWRTAGTPSASGAPG